VSGTEPQAPPAQQPGIPPAPVRIAAAQPAPVDPTPMVTFDPADESSLRKLADQAFAESDVGVGLQYLYMDALIHPRNDLWRSFRWNRALGRAMLGVRWGAAVELDDLASQSLGVPLGAPANRGGNPLEVHKSFATMFYRQTANLG